MPATSDQPQPLGGPGQPISEQATVLPWQADSEGLDRQPTVLSTGGVAAPSEPLERIGRYPVVDRLGAGGMGEVYSVVDERLQREVAAKAVRGSRFASTAETFLEEARITGQLDHPNIVPVYDLDQMADGRPFYTMKRVHGQTLRQWLEGLARRDPDRRPIGERLQVFIKVCDAMRYAHAQGVIHCDLKPDNVMLGPFGEVLVMDWGLARAERAPADGQGTGQPGVLWVSAAGTPAYMAPEQFSDGNELTEQVDVYALGALLYELLTLQTAFPSAIGDAVAERVRSGRFAPPSTRAPALDIPWELESVVLKAMALDPRQRYGTVEALRADVEAFLEGRLLATIRYGPARRAARLAARHPRAIALVLLICGLGAGAWLWRAQRVRQSLATGRLALEQRRYEDAREAFSRTLSLSPGHVDATFGARQAEQGQRAVAALAQRRAMATAALTEARAALADAPEIAALRTRWAARFAGRGLTERPESSDLRRDRERALRAHLAAVAALERALALAPDDDGARTLRVRAGEALGWVALFGGEYSLSAQAFADLERRGVEPARLRALHAEVEQARTRQRRGRDERIAAILEDVRRGLSRSGRELGAPTVEDYVFEVAGYREPQTVDRLRDALAPLVGKARRQRRRARWSQIERDLWRLCGQTLGRLQLEEAVPVLTRWVDALHDEALLVELSVALCNTGHPDAMAPLLRVQRRLGSASAAWQRISPSMRRLPDVLGRDATMDSIRDFAVRGVIRLERGDLDGAIADLHEVLRRAPDHLQAHAHLGRAYLQREQYAAALRHLQQTIALAPRRAAGYVQRGQAYIGLKQLDRAIADFDRALKLSPQQADAYLGRGLARWRQGAQAEVLEDFTRAIELEPERATGYSHRAIVLHALGRAREAHRDMDRALERDPDNHQLLSNRGGMRSLAGDHAGAIVDLTRAIALRPDHPDAHHNRATALRRKRSWSAALTDYSRAIQLEPTRHSAFDDRATLRATLGDFPGALADHDRACALQPENATYHRRRGDTRRRSGDAAGALSDYSRAIALDPGRQWWALYHRGRLFRAAKRTELALADFDRALAIRPRSAPVLTSRAEARLSRGELAGAERDYRAILAIDRRIWQAWAGLGFALWRGSQQDGAEQAWREALRRAPAGSRTVLQAQIDRVRSGTRRQEAGD